MLTFVKYLIIIDYQSLNYTFANVTS